MTLLQQIKDDSVRASKEGTPQAKQRLAVLRLLAAAIKNEEIAMRGKGSEINDEDVVVVLRRELKRRKEAYALYQSHGEEARAAAEAEEAKVIEGYVPKMMNEVDIETIIAEVARALPQEARVMGTLMKEVMAKCKGQAEGAQVRELVQRFLASGKE